MKILDDVTLRLFTFMLIPAFCFGLTLSWDLMSMDGEWIFSYNARVIYMLVCTFISAASVGVLLARTGNIRCYFGSHSTYSKKVGENTYFCCVRCSYTEKSIPLKDCNKQPQYVYHQVDRKSILRDEINKLVDSL